MKQASISLRLTFWLSAIFLAGFVLFGSVIWADLSYSLSKGRDRTLARRAARFIEVLNAARNNTHARQEHEFKELAEAIPEGDLIRIYDHAGNRVLPDIPNQESFPWPRDRSSTREQYSDVWYGGRRFRLLRLPATIGTEPLVVVVGGQLEDNRNMMGRLTTALIWATPAMLALCAFGGYFLSRRVLRPVDQITTTLRSINIGSLSSRLPISKPRDELRRLAETCNEMLARLEDAVDRINRFTADASHELRSPLALIRGVAEYALRNRAMDSESREAFEEILAEAIETGRLLEDLLTLARADAGYASALFEPVELTDLVGDVCARFRPQAETKGQTLTVRIPSVSVPVEVMGDRSSLRRLLSILLDNANNYTRANGSIEVGLSVTSTCAEILVKDNGIGIPEPLLPNIFDRFVRADPSRGEVHGTGLGLAIAKWIANTHGASLTVTSRENEGSVFKVEFVRLSDAVPITASGTVPHRPHA